MAPVVSIGEPSAGFCPPGTVRWRMHDGPRVFGGQSEDVAAIFLNKIGYRIHRRNYRTRLGEIDIVAYDGETLVFVEIKARRTLSFGEVHYAVDKKKRVKLSNLARQYIFRYQLKDQPCRFDLVLINSGSKGEPVIELMKNAFEFEGGSSKC